MSDEKPTVGRIVALDNQPPDRRQSYDDFAGVPYRTPACNEHLDRNDDPECPWCKLHEAQRELELMRRNAEYLADGHKRADVAESRLGRLRSILGQYDRDEIDDGDAFVAMCAVLEEAAVETPETHTSPVVSPETAGEHTQRGDHPEMWCGDCGRPNAVWFAPNALWNQVMGSPNGIICPACFAIRADNAGVSGVWKFDLHDALVDSD